MLTETRIQLGVGATLWSRREYICTTVGTATRNHPRMEGQTGNPPSRSPCLLPCVSGILLFLMGAFLMTWGTLDSPCGQCGTLKQLDAMRSAWSDENRKKLIGSSACPNAFCRFYGISRLRCSAAPPVGGRAYTE